ncbi:acyl-homoserine-lactone synthase [Streptomyces luteireticuli]|uniref:acyl-homoserine-lactone synthase n=1 Tax=Streptomyces luteireticuli TaxID=173858 RepID=UPI0031D8C66C
MSGRTAYEVLTGRPGDPGMTPALLEQMFRLRYEVFHQRLGWEVSGEGGLERDRFDELDPVYVIARHRADHTVVGCVRLLPTTGPYMLRDVDAFQPALAGHPAPRSPRIWEISRLAGTSPNGPTTTADAISRPAEAGLGPIPRALLTAVGDYAAGHGIDRFVTLSGLRVERRANASGIPSTRLGMQRPTRIGTVLCTAYSVSATALAALS